MNLARTWVVALSVLVCHNVAEAIPVFDDQFTSTPSSMSLTLSGAAVVPATAGGPVAFAHYGEGQSQCGRSLSRSS
jgi:hypothetical protein